MSVCEATRPAPLQCPDAPAILQSALALLPKGRAWQSHEGGPRVGSTLWGFWQAAADVNAYLAQRLCDLRLEFWCATHTETHDLWMAEYGLPDACDPYPDLCTKVAAIGGTRCEYYAAIAARFGWSITCREEFGTCGAEAGCAEVGCAEAAGLRPLCQLTIIVDLEHSAAYVSAWDGVSDAGCFEVGKALVCNADIDSLKCLIERIVHAEITVQYELIPPPTYLMFGDFAFADAGGAYIVE